MGTLIKVIIIIVITTNRISESKKNLHLNFRRAIPKERGRYLRRFERGFQRAKFPSRFNPFSAFRETTFECLRMQVLSSACRLVLISHAEE